MLTEIEVNYLYRYYRGFDGWDCTPIINCSEYPVIRSTKTGVWIRYQNGKKWVSLKTKKRFAYPTKEEAIHGFIKKTQRAVEIQSSALKTSKLYLQQAKNIKAQLNPKLC